MGCLILFTLLLIISFGALGIMTGDMTAFTALTATLAIGLDITGILYRIHKLKERRKETFNPLSPTLRWMNTAGSILIAANQHTNFCLIAGWQYNNKSDQKLIKTLET